MPGSLTCLIWLTLGAFAIGTEGFMIAGLLPALARDLNVGLPAAGQLVTAFSLAYALGAPVMAVLTAGLERRRMLAIAMSGFILANLLAALAPGYAGLLAARLLLALAAGCFMPAASGYAATLGGPERRGRALSMVNNGLTLAIIAGVPLGVLVGDGFGWRATFLGVAGLATLSLLGILAWLPRQSPGTTASLGERLAVAARRDVLAVLATSVLIVAGTFTVYTYLGVFLAAVVGLGPHGLALVLLGFGLASAAGTRFGGSAADRWGGRRTVILGSGLALLAFLALSLGATLGPARAMPVLLPAILLWGLASWGLITAQQARLVTLAPALTSISLSLNSSAIYLGSATGAAVGALVIAHGAVAELGWVSAGFSLAALLTVLGTYGTGYTAMPVGSTGAAQSPDDSGNGFDPAERSLDPLADALRSRDGAWSAHRWSSGGRTGSAPHAVPHGRRARGRGVAWVGTLLAALAAIAAGHTWRSDATEAAASVPPPRVTVAKPLQETVACTTILLGQFSAVDTVELRAQVGGILTQIAFQDGQIVHERDPLFTIDPRPLQFKLDQAIAQLQTAEAKQSLADVQLWRARQLKQSDFGSAEVVDQRAADQHNAQAAIENAKPAINDAQLDLEFSRVTAPFTGRIGAHLVSVGNLVSGSRGGAGQSTLLATVVSLDPIYFDFDMSESDYRAYQRAHGGTAPRDDVAISLGGDDRFDRHGTLDFIDNAVNRSSGTIHARATVANPDLGITPGQFARIRVPLGRPVPALLLPPAAVVPDQANEVVMTVAADGTIVPMPVEIGELYHGLRVILSGLAATDTVVIDGLVRVRPGAKVTPAQGTITGTGGNDAD